MLVVGSKTCTNLYFLQTFHLYIFFFSTTISHN